MKLNIIEKIKSRAGAFEKNRHLEDARARLFAALPYWIAAIGTGLLATAFSKLFRFAELEAQQLYAEFGIWMVFLTPMFFILSWLSVELFAPYANGSGIPQLMAAAEISKSELQSGVLDRLLGMKVIGLKMISAILAVFAGGAIGREGPTLQLSGGVFYLVGKLFNKASLEVKSKHGLILAGGAAGLAAAFNTPLGGIAYVVEELSKSHLSSFRTGILHAVIVSGFIAQLIMGPYLYLGYPKVPVFEISLVAQILIVALSSGLVAVLFSEMLKAIVGFKISLNTRMKRMIFVTLCGVSFSVFVIFISKNAMGSGKEILNELLYSGKKADFLEVFSRFFGSSVTYAVGGAGGIFAPTLSLGGAVASYVGGFFSSDAGALGVLVGMTAALASLTHSPLTSFVLILEMTDRHSSIFPLMVAAVVGHGISKAVSRTSFYEFICHRILAGETQIKEGAHAD